MRFCEQSELKRKDGKRRKISVETMLVKNIPTLIPGWSQNRDIKTNTTLKPIIPASLLFFMPLLLVMLKVYGKFLERLGKGTTKGNTKRLNMG